MSALRPLCLISLCLLLAAALLPQAAAAQDSPPTPVPEPMPAPVPAPAGLPVEPASQVVKVPLEGVTSVATGVAHACAVAGGGVFCWGANTLRQLGDGTTTTRVLPVRVVGLPGPAVAVAAGYNHTCAVLANGTAWCWGDNQYGQLGNGTMTVQTAPVAVSGLQGVAALALGSRHSCARTTTGGVKCWGNNAIGQLGDGTRNSRALPGDVSGLLSGVGAIAAGEYHTCAAPAAGGVKCWGDGRYCQLGDGLCTSSNLPVTVSYLSVPVASLGAGQMHTCAARATGEVSCWGGNGNGQLGDPFAGGSSSTPTGVYGLSSRGSALAITGGYQHNCAVLPSGGVRCWGNNSYGQLGDGTMLTSDSAVQVIGLAESAVQVSGGFFAFTCARSAAGRAWCWGDNRYGQLGDGTIAQRGLAAPVLSTIRCYKLTATSSGAAGSAPITDPPQSAGCPASHFYAGAPVQIIAAPASGNKVRAWQNVPGGTPGVNVALYTMPAADSSINVLYGVCNRLGLAIKGGTGPLLASPANSLGCGNGRYGVSDRITLVASPSTTQRVKAWTGAAITPGTGLEVNTVLMPDAPMTVTVTYEACVALSVSVQGSGEAPIVYPAQSEGCAAGTYAAGETVTLVARPAPGYLVAGWQGTDDVSPFAAAQITMPEGGAAVGVVYAPASHTVWLPAIQQ